jgi:predicted dehydrogenase
MAGFLPSCGGTTPLLNDFIQEWKMDDYLWQAVTRRKFIASMGIAPAALLVANTGCATATPQALASSAGTGAAGGAGASAASTARITGRPMPSESEDKLGDPPSLRLGLAVVGLGNYAIGQILPRIAGTQHVRLVAVVSGNKEKARAVAAAYGLSERSVYDYAGFDQLRDDAAVDAVYIILPPALHAEYTIRAAQLGKHVLCEKPMASTSDECRRMIDACERANRRLMIGYRVHWEPHNVEAVQLLRKGTIGTIRQIVGQHGTPVDPTTAHGEWRIQRALAGGGSLWDVGIYSLNGARLLSGEEPVEIRAAWRLPAGSTIGGTVADVELGVNWEARFPSGLAATATSSFDYMANQISVHGDKGSIELSPATSYQGNELRIENKAGRQEPKVGESDEQFFGMLDEFALAVRENREPRTSGREGLQDIRLMELIYEAARTGRTVPVPSAR